MPNMRWRARTRSTRCPKKSRSRRARALGAYGTAYTALRHHADARAGETLLIHGQRRRGIAAVQWARALGLTVIGTAGTLRGLELAKKEGAHHVFDHTKAGYPEDILKATGGRGIDLILEMLANVNLATDLKLLAFRGRVIVIGNRGEITINPRELMARRASVRALRCGRPPKRSPPKFTPPSLPALGNGTLRPIVGKELPLKDAPQAHVDVLAPGAFGKIVLIP